MGKTKKSQRDVARLSGKPLCETLEPSFVLRTSLGTEEEGQWVTSPDLTEYGLPFSTEDVRSTTFFLLANPGLNSTVLFRADILFDTDAHREGSPEAGDCTAPLPARDVPGFELSRTIARRLIPRNPQLDRPLDQTCHFYQAFSPAVGTGKAEPDRFLILYTPHVSRREELPYYHPMLRSLAFLYDVSSPSAPTEPKAAGGVMSLHFLAWPAERVHNRLERTLSKLLEVQIRLTRGRLAETPETRSPYAPIKDNVIPRHRVQDTYTRLKTKHAADLCSRWVESTEPSKHVFEDLGVAAFLIELWREMYCCVPVDEVQPSSRTERGLEGETEKSIERKLSSISDSVSLSTFPGFVDIACGNGVLVYILLQEGYPGRGFDARRRKTWGIFPASVQEHLREEIYIPKPFADEMSSSGASPLNSVETHTGTPPTFPKNTFIVSNHADELTLWTPLLATLLNPTEPQPFLAIPCCSHSLSGARYRYPPQNSTSSNNNNNNNNHTSFQESHDANNPETNSATGDLKALRAAKIAASEPGSAAFNKSSYGALTEKLVALATEVGYAVEKTLLRIPSTRNIGVLGRFRVDQGSARGDSGNENGDEKEDVLDRVSAIVAKECVRDGGVNLAARTWAERAAELTAGGGSGQRHAHSHV
ncbi:DUF1613-domain-containing protein [Aspergillus pseudoustus]|uniref:tRNA (uracil-O(2)-)-methyltransferase n=1 Tax=Aspergillus pseudoustus TaxID=1810923 RepID=A0ABR4JY96_9EURO